LWCLSGKSYLYRNYPKLFWSQSKEMAAASKKNGFRFEINIKTWQALHFIMYRFVFMFKPHKVLDTYEVCFDYWIMIVEPCQGFKPWQGFYLILYKLCLLCI
jgi:hypothetical protein